MQSGPVKPQQEASRFRRNLQSVALANIASQLLLVAAAPLLTRLYGPDDFGGFGVFAALMGIALAFATGWFEWLIPNPRSAVRGAALFCLGLILLIVSAGLMTAMVFLFADDVPGDELATVQPYLWLFPLILLASGAQQLLLAWHIRRADLRRMSWLRMAQVGVNVSLSVAIAWWGGHAYGPLGLLAGMGLGTLVSALGLAWREPLLAAALAKVNRFHLAASWRRYRREAGWSSLATTLASISTAIVPLLLARHFPVVEVGLYVLAQRVALTPLGTITAAVHRSFWAEAAHLMRTDQPALSRLFDTSVRRLLLLSMPVLMVTLAGPFFVGPVFGRGQWDGAGWLLLVSAPMVLGQLVMAPLSHLGVRGRQHWQAAWDAVRLILLIFIVEYCGAKAASITVTVGAVSLVYAAMHLVLYILNKAAMQSDLRRARPSAGSSGVRVAHLTTVHRRDDIRIYHKQCRALAAKGFEVHLCVGDGRGDQVLGQVQVHDIGAVRGRARRILFQPLKMARRAAALRADVYHLHDPELVFAGWWLSFRAKVVYDSHEDFPRALLSKFWIPAPLRRPLAAFSELLEDFVAARLDAVSAATPRIARRFRRVNPRTVEVNNFPLAEELAPAPGTSRAARTACYLGGLSLVRGVLEMVRAMEHVDGRLLLAGPFDSPETERLCRAEPGWANVEYLGVLDRAGVRAVMGKACVGLVVLHPEPNYIESLPIKMFEYMSAGLPVIASNFPYWRELLLPDAAGTCVDPLDPTAIAAALRELFDNPDLARGMGARGQQAVKAKYQWNTESARLVGLYADLGAVAQSAGALPRWPESPTTPAPTN